MAYLEERQGCKIISHIPFLREGGNLESMITSLRVIEGVDRDSLGEGERTGQVTLDLLPVRLGVQVGGHGQVVALTHLVKEFKLFIRIMVVDPDGDCRNPPEPSYEKNIGTDPILCPIFFSSILNDQSCYKTCEKGRFWIWVFSSD